MKILGNHTYPVFFDEISRAGKEDCASFVDLLNSSYRTQHRHHGTKGTFLLAAPVCMIGQDNPVNDSAFNTKTIQFRLDDAKNKDGLFIPKAPFPVREFAEWLLARWTTETASKRLKAHEASLEQSLKRDPNDKNIGRFVQNYAALQFATEELFEFSGYRNESIWQTITDMMNHHLAASVTIRRESVAILEKLVEEMMLATRTEDQIIHKVESGCLIIPTNAILPCIALGFLETESLGYYPNHP